MKPTLASTIEHRLARYDHRAESRYSHPATDQFFRPLTSASASHAWRQPSPRACHAFRQMTALMLTKHERDQPMELALYAVVTAVAFWPVVDLLVVLAQTASG